MRLVLGLVLILALMPSPLPAHTRAQANLTITVRSNENGVEADFIYEGEVEVSEEVALIPDSSLTPEEAQAKAKVLASMLLEGRGLRTQEGTLCTWVSPIAAVVNHQLFLQSQANCPGKVTALKWSVSAVDGLENGFLYMIKLDWDGNQSVFVADKGVSEVTLSSAPSSFGGFIVLGMEHIGATPSQWRSQTAGLQLPDGIDHILFVLALILGALSGGGILGILKSVTGFTLGHSLTLAIATLGLASPPSRWIESAIALSIVYVATEDLLERGRGRRWVIAALFGLIHGFGFAGALRELSLARSQILPALLGFNLGVELGQAFFVIILFPMIMLTKGAGKSGHWVLKGIMLGILLVSSWWFVRRAFAI